MSEWMLLKEAIIMDGFNKEGTYPIKRSSASHKERYGYVVCDASGGALFKQETETASSLNHYTHHLARDLAEGDDIFVLRSAVMEQRVGTRALPSGWNERGAITFIMGHYYLMKDKTNKRMTVFCYKGDLPHHRDDVIFRCVG